MSQVPLGRWNNEMTLTLTLEPLWEKEGFQSNSHSDFPSGVSVSLQKELIGTQEESAQVLKLDLLMEAHGAQLLRMLLASAAAAGGPGEIRSVGAGPPPELPRGCCAAAALPAPAAGLWCRSRAVTLTPSLAELSRSCAQHLSLDFHESCSVGFLSWPVPPGRWTLVC